MIRIIFYADEDGPGIGDLIEGPQRGVPTHVAVESDRYPGSPVILQIDAEGARWDDPSMFLGRSRIALFKEVGAAETIRCWSALDPLVGRKYNKLRLPWILGVHWYRPVTTLLRRWLVDNDKVICTDSALAVLAATGTPYPHDAKAASIFQVFWHCLMSKWTIDYAYSSQVMRKVQREGGDQ